MKDAANRYVLLPGQTPDVDGLPCTPPRSCVEIVRAAARARECHSLVASTARALAARTAVDIRDPANSGCRGRTSGLSEYVVP